MSRPFSLYPAIDLKDGKCVRLLHGDMSKATEFSSAPAQQAQVFRLAGFDWLHVVDLNGAFAGQSINKDAIEAIRANTDAQIQLGGGIRTMESIQYWLDLGIQRVILGTIALTDPELVRTACREFPTQIVVGIDARGGNAAPQGWVTQTEVAAVDLAHVFEDCGVAAIIYTDIARDGAMQGPNLAETKKLAESISIPVILSGGMTTLSDVQAVLDARSSGVQGAILGRALYEGSIPPTQAMALVNAAIGA
jgi:phosphoribosylformimino-5-aminoimidazole carboxamide ribotide isomerase